MSFSPANRRNGMSATRPASAMTSRAGLRWVGCIFTLIFPTIITWTYFVFAERYSATTQQITYIILKTVQFVFPLVWVALVLRERIHMGKPGAKGVLTGLAFSVVVVASGWILFDRVLRYAESFADAAVLIENKVSGFGIDSVGKYIILAAFYSLFHSFLEEYYWRWFVFGQLRFLVSRWPAILISALGFMAHHVIVLGEFFKATPWWGWLFSLAVAAGGVFWAWLYHRSGSLLGPWLSHLLIDAGIFGIGMMLVGPSLVP